MQREQRELVISTAARIELVNYALTLNTDVINHVAGCNQCTDETCPEADELYGKTRSVQNLLDRAGIVL